MKKLFVTLTILCSVFCLNSPVWAVPFPEKTDAVVQDPSGILPDEEEKEFARFVQQFPDSYKVVVVESTQPEAENADEYAQKLFDNYNVSDDTMMLVLDLEAQQLGVYAGPALQAKGAKLEMLHDKIASYYDPYHQQKKYLEGLRLFITEVNAELARIAENPAAADRGDAAEPGASSPASAQEPSLFASLPWWVYLVALVFLVFLVGSVYTFFKRRSLFADLDEVEDWKDELVEKLNALELEKPLRRSSGATGERYALLANRKETILRVRIPEVEMIILDTEDACDRLRFRMAQDLVAEAREILKGIEQELEEIKADALKVVQTKKENRLVYPEVHKLIEAVERKLTNARLEYGLSFHELKLKLDEAERLRGRIKEALAEGDDVKAQEAAEEVQQLLGELNSAIAEMPKFVSLVQKEMPNEFKQLEEDISLAIDEGYELNQDRFDLLLLQAKQILIAARTALEEGNLSMVETHRKAFAVKIEETYQTLEQVVLSKRQVAAAQAERHAEIAGEPVWTADAPDSAEDVPAPAGSAARERTEELQVEPMEMAPDERTAFVAGEREDALVPETEPAEPDTALHKGQPQDEQAEYELVIPRYASGDDKLQEELNAPPVLVIESEEDALNELERISAALVKIRQRIKRSYLPGIPGDMKFHFDQVVEALARIKTAMEQYRYNLDEVTELLRDAHEKLDFVENLANEIIAACQLAEGAIQYTNRYRRQNRQVNEMIEKAEAAFRQLRFQEAYSLAEEARLLVEGDQQPEATESRWLLRRKRKGAGN